jgi:ATP-binding cassette subfamily C protein LapB
MFHGVSSFWRRQTAFLNVLQSGAYANSPIFHQPCDTTLAVPIFTLQVYDRVVAHAGLSTLEGLIIGMTLVVIFDYALRQSRSRVMQTVALRVDVLIGRNLFNKVTELPLQTLESQPSAHWQSLFRDVDTVRNALSGASAILVADLPFAILFLGLIFIIAPAVAWVLLIILPVFTFVAWRSGNVMAAANSEERQTSQSRDSLIAEMISGRTTVKALALDGAMRPLWEDKHADNIEKSILRGSKTDTYSNIGASLGMVTSIAVTTIGAIAIIDQRLTIGALIATNMLSGRLLGPLNQLVTQWRTYTNFKQSVERLGEVFNTPSERQESEVELVHPNGEITVENISFSYSEDQQPVVDSVNVAIKAGGVHALVGRNGSGKTTLLKLILGLYKPSEGRVLLDGADISQFTRSELARWIGYVPQECVLFAGSVRDNIVNRFPEATDEQLIKAATASGVHKFIIDMPDGYATEIGEAGSRLSGGQRQRIAIARALVGDPSVLLLDEPSSSLDRQAEQELRRTLHDIGHERTVIIVTHSPILLAICKDLVALDKGKVALAGPAKEILPRLFGKAPGTTGRKETQTSAQQQPAANPSPAAAARTAAPKASAKPRDQAKARPPSQPRADPQPSPATQVRPPSQPRTDPQPSPATQVRPQQQPPSRADSNPNADTGGVPPRQSKK